MIQPCLPAAMRHLRLQRRFRGAMYDLEIHNCARPAKLCRLEVDGKEMDGMIIPVKPGGTTCRVRCMC